MTLHKYTFDELEKLFADITGYGDPRFNDLPEEEQTTLFDNYSGIIGVISVWAREGKGIAIYENQDFGHSMAGHKRFFSFGTDDAQFDLKHCPRCMSPLTVQEFQRLCSNIRCSGRNGFDAGELLLPPKKLPDFPGEINWRYQLIGTYRDSRYDPEHGIDAYYERMAQEQRDSGD